MSWCSASGSTDNTQAVEERRRDERKGAREEGACAVVTALVTGEYCDR